MYRFSDDECVHVSRHERGHHVIEVRAHPVWRDGQIDRYLGEDPLLALVTVIERTSGAALARFRVNADTVMREPFVLSQELGFGGVSVATRASMWSPEELVDAAVAALR